MKTKLFDLIKLQEMHKENLPTKQQLAVDMLCFRHLEQ